MDAHQNARTTPRSRMLIAERLHGGWTVTAVATGMGIDPKTVRKWRDRFAAEGEAGLLDRSSRPHRSPTRLDEEAEGDRLVGRSGPEHQHRADHQPDGRRRHAGAEPGPCQSDEPADPGQHPAARRRGVEGADEAGRYAYEIAGKLGSSNPAMPHRSWRMGHTR
nr:leucine zipper domain-containing protein [Enterovirga sp. DB1703]